MRETHDTMDGLLAEFRGYSAGMPPSYHVTMSWADFRRMLDRFDAAHRRELSKNTSKNGADFGQLGDAAKLREALVKIEKMAHCDLCNVYPKYRDKFNDMIGGIELEARVALSAPPRNCDIVPIEAPEAADMFHRERPYHGYCYETHDWLLAPATEQEGGAK